MRQLIFALLLSATTTSAAAQSAKPLEVTEASVTQLQQAMAEGRATSASITRAYLARIAAYDQSGPRLNAIIRLNPRALAEVAALDAERKAGKVRGPMHGIPFILKDNYDTGDMPTTAGSLALANSQPARDGFITKQIRDAGGVLIAKSNMHELAAGITSISSLGGQTRNPYDPARCPGGSSGGTGAAIAASFAAVGWGSDTCGSIRIPSAFGALVGLRPTVGYDPADPVTVLVKDKRPRFMDALKPGAFKGARIGVFAPYFRETDAEIADSVRAAIATMKSLGATVIDVPMPEFDTLMVNTGVTNQETKHDLENAAHTLTLSRQAALRARVERVIDSLQLDAIAYPTMRQAPVFPGEIQAGSTCQLGAQSGLPSIAFPAGFTADGLPVSVELLGKAMSDVQLVSFAYAFEQHGSRRRAPSTTPALVAGKAPAPRVVGPDVRTASGSLPLSARDREAFGKGLLSVALYTASGKAVEATLR
ncbi:amidase [Gemmatimonas sp.]|uniref:amidase n=1 Tax=Gemmatimonas sp. TaxID=1962908 RepID=UPI003F709B9D